MRMLHFLYNKRLGSLLYLTSTDRHLLNRPESIVDETIASYLDAAERSGLSLPGQNAERNDKVAASHVVVAG